MERFRDKLKAEASWEMFPQDLASEVFMVAHEMHWKIEYILEMPPWEFQQIAEEIRKYYEAQENAETGGQLVQTLG